MRKYLPDFHVFVRFDRHLVGESRLFLVNREAQITDLGEADWQGNPDTKCWRVARVAEFLRARKIKVQSGDDAIEVAKLFEELQGAPNYVAFLKVNTKDFTLFDKHFMERFYGPNVDFKYTSAERAGGWTIKVEYVGPPAMVREPPTYEIDLDEQHNFQDLRRYPYSTE